MAKFKTEIMTEVKTHSDKLMCSGIVLCMLVYVIQGALYEYVIIVF